MGVVVGVVVMAVVGIVMGVVVGDVINKKAITAMHLLKASCIFFPFSKPVI